MDVYACSILTLMGTTHVGLTFIVLSEELNEELNDELIQKKLMKSRMKILMKS